MNTNIVIKNVHISFSRNEGDVYAVRDFSAEIRSGKVTGIVGESGSGKSVLGMSILKLLPDNARVSGEILLEGHNILKKDENEMRYIRGSVVGLIPQSPSEALNPSIKIWKQVAEPFMLHKGQNKKTARQSAESLLAQFNFPNIKRSMSGYGFQLSGGMKQRVISTFGIANEPQWVIADEPTKGLDRSLEAQVADVLIEVSKKSSMLIITHDLLLAQKLCDDVIVMHNGLIIEQGSDGILSKPLHPYTRGLVDSIPSNGMKPMPFTQEDTNNNSCPINSWCPFRTNICGICKPPLVKLKNRQVRCHHYD